MDKLTTKSQEALAEAISLAADRGNPQVEPLHLLSALLGQQGGVAVALLDAVGVNRADVAARANAATASPHYKRTSPAATACTNRHKR